MNWYYVEAGQQRGPVDDAGLAELVAGGKVAPDTLVWREGMANWQAYRETQPGGGLRINRGAEPGQPAAAAAAPASGGEEAVCAECGGIFPVNDTIRIGEARVCANCKPIFVQKMREGVNVGAGSFHYAGFWIRFAAVFLDGILLNIVNVLIRVALGLGMIGTIMPTPGTTTANPSAFLATTLLATGLQFLIALGYEAFMVGKYGATLGKMACKIHVVTADGAPVSYGLAVGRYFAKLVSGIICSIGYIMAGFDDEKRALHDRMCSTRVVYK